jgi:hypothetical protein
MSQQGEGAGAPVTGSCLCGKVAYEIDGHTSKIWLCHCSKCRKSTGSAFHSSAICRAEQFRWIRGEEEISEYRDTPGYVVRFCGNCGSPVPSYLSEYDAVFLHVGALDGDVKADLNHHIFVGSKAPWFEILDALPKYDEHVTAEPTSS